MEVEQVLGFWRDSEFYAWELLKFMTFFYAVWAPGFIVAGLLSCRFRYQVWNSMLSQPRFGFGAVVKAVAAGVVGSAGRKATLSTAGHLLGRGMPGSLVLVFLLAARNMTFHFWALFALSLGAEFATGQVLGTLVMIGVLAVALQGSALRPIESLPREFHKESYLSLPGFGSWWEALFSLRGNLAVVEFFAQELRRFLPSLMAGIVLGGMIFAAGLRRWWFPFADVFGQATFYSDCINALAGAFLGSVVSLSPVGNLPVIHALFKTDGLNYPGIISFCLASALHPMDIRAYRKAFDSRKVWVLVGSLYLGAVLGGLGSTWIYSLFGFRPSLPPANLAGKFLQSLLSLVGF